jgi:hypothetical protein
MPCDTLPGNAKLRQLSCQAGAFAPKPGKDVIMKVNFTIDCTPEEARAFFGLPDLSSVHEAYLDKLKSTIIDGVTPADFEKMTRTWMPGIADGFEQWQKLFMAAIPKPPQ